MADTPRSLPDLQTILADNAVGAISPQDVRDFLVSVYAPVQQIEVAASNSATIAKARADYLCDGTDDEAQIQSAITATAATAHKRLHLNAGTYNLSGMTGGTILDLSTNNDLYLYGDGASKTILSYPVGKTLTASLNIIELGGLRQRVGDLRIQVGTGTPAGYVVRSIRVGAAALHALVERVEIAGIFGAGDAGGSGLDLYKPWDQATAQTTLGTAITAGADRVATPGSMAGIYDGCWLRITGGTQEDVVVKSVTATTFTADYANNQDADHVVSIMGNGAAFGTYRDVYIHDFPTGCGIICNSRGNLFDNVRIVKIGTLTTQHGIYTQQGGNEYRDCYVEGVFGYSCQFYNPSVDNTEQSGSKWNGFVSVNPGEGHLVLYGCQSASATNPQLLSGEPNARYHQVIGCTFRNTKDYTNTPGGVTVNDSAIISGCVFEDANLRSGDAAINVTGADTQAVIANNLFDTLRTTAAGKYIYVRNDARVLIEGNTFRRCKNIVIDLTGGGTPATSGCVISNNLIVGNYSSVLVTIVSGCRVVNNYIEQQGSGYAITFESCLDIEIAGNIFKGTGGAHYLTYMASGAATAGSFHDNTITNGIVYYQICPIGLALFNNAGQFAQLGEHSALVTLGKGSGKFRKAISPASGYQWSGYVVKQSAGLTFALATSTDDAVWCGITVSECLNNANPAYITGMPGDVVPMAADAAWTAGNVGKLAGTSAAGKIHDQGNTTIPASGRYVVFLDTGGAAGIATVLISSVT